MYSWTESDSMLEIFTICFEVSEVHSNMGVDEEVCEKEILFVFTRINPASWGEYVLACNKRLKEDSVDSISTDHPRLVEFEKVLREYKPKLSSRMRSILLFLPLSSMERDSQNT